MELYIEKVPPAVALRKLIRVAIGLKGCQRINQLSLETSAGTSNHNLTSTPVLEEKIFANEDLQKHINWLERSRFAEIKSCSITVQLQHNDQKCTLTMVQGAIYDKIRCQSNDVATVMKMLDHVGEQYQAIPDERRRQSDADVLEAIPRELLTEVTRRLTESAVDLRAATKEGLAQFLSSVAATDKAVTEKLQAEYAKQRADIEAQRTKLEAEAAEQKKKLQEEIEAGRQKLQQERAEFEAEKKKLDDRRSTHVRRELFQQLGSRLAEQKKVELSLETNKKLWPIRLVCALVAIGAIALCLFGGHLMLTKHDSLGWMSFVPFSTGVVVFTLNALYFVRFSNAWLARHADLETRNQLLQFDMARASWFAEMLFEYKDEKNGTVPESVIRVMTKNLFELQAGSGDGVQHPVDDVAAFLARVNRIRLGEGEVEMDAAVQGQAKKKG